MNITIEEIESLGFKNISEDAAVQFFEIEDSRACLRLIKTVHHISLMLWSKSTESYLFYGSHFTGNDLRELKTLLKMSLDNFISLRSAITL